jgi:hypothetical protein
MDLSYNAVNTFAQLHADAHKYLFCRGPVGSGKSSGCIWHLVLNGFEQKVQFDGIRRSKYGIIRASYPALKSTVIKSWKMWFKSLINIVYDTPIRGEMWLPHPDGETQVHIELVFIALDREDDVNKLQSLELTGCHINEAAEIPRGVHQMVKSRINRYPEGSVGAIKPFIIADYNSVDTEHWLYKIAEEEQPLKHAFYHQPSALLMVDPTDERIDPDNPIYDNARNWYIINPDADNLGHWEYGDNHKPPTQTSIWSDQRQRWWVPHLDKDYYPDQVLGAEPDWVNVMLLNNYGQLRTGRPVYSEYRDDIHFTDRPIKPIKGVKIIIGMDLGLTPAAAFMQLTPTGKLIVFDELVTEDCSIQQFCEDYLKPKIQNEYSKFNYELIVDPAATQRSQNDKRAAAEVIRAAGLPYRTAHTNNATARREAVVYFLRKIEGFVLGPKCKFLRKGFISEYKYEKKRLALSAASSDPQFKEKPEKNIYSHIHDGCQYGATELSGGRTARRKRRTPRGKQQDHIGDNTAGY